MAGRMRLFMSSWTNSKNVINTADDCGKLVEVHPKKYSLNNVRTFMDSCTRHMPCSITTEHKFLRSVIIERLFDAQEKRFIPQVNFAV